MKVKEILSRKSTVVHSVSPEVTVFEALKKMADANVGALPVKQGDKLVGIFSERDYARKVVLMGKFSRDITVMDVMDMQFVTVTEEDDIAHCMSLMTDKFVRHLPVLRYDNLIGIVSIGDVVKCIIREQEYVIESLSNYISGSR